MAVGGIAWASTLVLALRWLHSDVGLDFMAATTTGRHAHQVAIPLTLALSEALQPGDLCIRSR